MYLHFIRKYFCANAKESDDIDHFYASLAIKARQLTPKKRRKLEVKFLQEMNNALFE